MDLYLIPPSEWKMKWWKTKSSNEYWSWSTWLLCRWLFPWDIAKHATQKDLKCSWSRYEEWILMNKQIDTSPRMKAICRYTWVMFSALWYESLSEHEKKYIDTHVLIVSWYYWLLRPSDMIANYKLPVWARWVKKHRKPLLTQILIQYCLDYWVTHIIDVLPKVHQSLFEWHKIEEKWIYCTVKSFTRIDENWNTKLLTHGVKKVKWERLRSQIQQIVWA